MTMSDSSFELTEKGGTRHSQSKEISDHPYLTQQQEVLVEASEPSSSVHDDKDVEANGDGLHQVRTGTSLRQVPSSKPSVNNIRSVPNGGTIAWLQVLASFFLFFNSWGIVNTFGMSQSHVAESCMQVKMAASVILDTSANRKIRIIPGLL
jgi:hypothetical protein